MTTTTLRDLLIDSRDGEWGESQAGAGRVRMRVIRGTDFPDVRQGDFQGVPLRYLEQRHAIRKRLQFNDILLETAGGTADRPTGRTALVTRRVLDGLGEDVTCASFARFIRIDPDKAEPAFVFWLLQHHYAARNLLQFHLQHTGVARFQFTTFADTFVLRLPDRDQQQRVASILAAYDDLIEVNRRRIALLEEMARRLFDEWFVRMRFPGREADATVGAANGPLPEGWEWRSLPEVCVQPNGIQTGPFGSQLHQADYVDEGVPVVMPMNMIGFRIAKDKIAYISEQKANELVRHRMVIGDVAYGRRGDIGRRAYISSRENGWFCGTGCLRLRPDPTRIGSRYFFDALGHPTTLGAIRARAQGATMPNLSAGAMSGVPVLVPPPALQGTYDDIAGHWAELSASLVASNTNLSAQRDLLLPRLMSGELALTAAERELEDAA
ncbi:restriction endonuclease subunit S [Mesorhizobium delmotii]|uniref:Restriction endonuclease subunit S n=1 Tax=Mesorhizobium delmotii TaxID=1631247 RepID=A0A2P9AS86_9HYPH|nr:restriction endonuclease subunit S [Mesorhizobium delmotii]SJM34031.1 hypothetical protein BQ8482_380214 [Mesorhizobium delmotii]